MGITYEAIVEVRHQYPSGSRWDFAGYFNLGGKVYDFVDVICGEHNHVNRWPDDLSHWVKDYQEIDPMDLTSSRYVVPLMVAVRRVNAHVQPIPDKTWNNVAFVQYILSLASSGAEGRILVWGS